MYPDALLMIASSYCVLHIRAHTHNRHKLLKNRPRSTLAVYPVDRHVLVRLSPTAPDIYYLTSDLLDFPDLILDLLNLELD